MTAVIKTFDDLSKQELYDILQARAAVFIVEQNCPWQDLDGRDQQVLHVMVPFEGRLGAYCRVLPPGLAYAEWSIGRVITLPHARGQKLGHVTMRAALQAIGKASVRIGAQSYLKKFYESHGFTAVGEEYIEDNIPHIEMLKAA